MSNLVIATPALSDLGTLTAGNELGSLPAANLLTKQPGRVWRSDGLTDLSLVLDLGAAAAINLVALLNHNASPAATWRIRAADSEAGLTSAPGYDSQVGGNDLEMWDATWPTDQDPLHAILWLSAAQTFRWWRIDISDDANPDGYFEAGRLYVSAAWQLPRNISYGWSLTWADPSQHARSKGGQLSSEELGKWRILVCPINWLDEDAMYGDLYELQRRRGTTKDVLVIRDPEATTHLLRQSIYGQMTVLEPLVQERFRIFRARLVVEELIP